MNNNRVHYYKSYYWMSTGDIFKNVKNSTHSLVCVCVCVCVCVSLRRLRVNGSPGLGAAAVVSHLQLFKLCFSQDCLAAWTTTRPARKMMMKLKSEADRCRRTQRALVLRRPPAPNPPRSDRHNNLHTNTESQFEANELYVHWLSVYFCWSLSAPRALV